MKSSCVRHPENNRYIQVHEWQIRFCQHNHCAALLLSFFINWHEWKLKNDHYYCKANNIAEAHGDGRPHNECAYLFFSMEELIEGTMNFYGKNAINEALQLLTSLNVLTVHKNPNPRYHFDKTKYFQFYSSVCNYWITENYPISAEFTNFMSQHIDYSDTPKQANRSIENNQRSAEIGRPSNEIGKAITNTTNNTTNKNQSIKTRDNFFDDENRILGTQNENKNWATIQPIIDTLTEAGLPTKHFTYPDTVGTLQQLCDAGATVDVFREAYILAARTSQNFGVNYLAKVVADLLRKNKLASKQPKAQLNAHTPNNEEDFKHGLDWMGDLLDL